MFPCRTTMHWFTRLLLVVFAVLSLVVLGLDIQTGSVAHAANNGLGATPYLGWSSWSLTGNHVSGYGNSWLNAAHVEAQSDAMHQKLQSHGFAYINLDAYWYKVSSGVFGVDAYGRWTPDTTRFPDLAAVGSYVHHNGQKFGLYLVPGIPKNAVDQNTPIKGTSCHAKDITVQPLTEGNHFKNTYKIDYSKSCAQAYIDSMAAQLHAWGADFLKLDGVAPGSAVAGYDTRADVEAYAKALNPYHIWLALSSSVVIDNISTWRANANSWRIEGDVECYSACSTPALTIWSKIVHRFSDAPKWAQYAGPGGWNDLDSLDVGNGSMDGITNDERQTTTTLWAISAAPLYTGDDIAKLDSYGLSLLTNDEVIAVDQTGKPATPVSQASDQQVWKVKNADGSYTVALFNLGSSTATVTANWSDLGFSGSANVRDLWSHNNLGSFSGHFSASLKAHASRLLKVMP
ncbi:alpha-galactosidase [Reticulibacter mediterranei]|uniref:Alpha-galactosidase n=1 Tax=Reticulibacter mediterranei TaxID=2778369 RepID=A0A8J3IWH5_9CHLR|nr:glycoside hydrolase family 27 protein [Reticulibacter mediterranei]GHO99793.1 alpha-galactosidase [Reticulibacter mediterranei]